MFLTVTLHAFLLVNLVGVAALLVVLMGSERPSWTLERAPMALFLTRAARSPSPTPPSTPSAVPAALREPSARRPAAAGQYAPSGAVEEVV